MQAGVLANPPSALAVHDEGLFELDGNAVNAGATAGDDWDQVFNGSHHAQSTQFITDPVNDSNDETFTGGSSKDDLNTTSWLWKHAEASQAKNDITHAFAAAYTDPDNAHTLAYFGLNKLEADGDNFVGFWFFKSAIAPTGPGTPPGSPFSGSGHSVGDILVLADYTNGGSLATFSVYKWVGSGGDVNGTLQTVASGVPCTAAGDIACGATNGSTEVAPWPYEGRDGDPGEFPPGTLFEGGIDLTALGLDTSCFTTFVAETRSSQSVDATLSDFALGNFSFCVTPEISTQVSGTSFVIGGGSVSDTAHLSGSKGVPTGTVDFFLCGPTGAAADCTSGGADAGQDKAVNGSGDAVSNLMSPTTPGFYCFRAEYTPTQGSKYLAVTHVSATNECFQAQAPQIPLLTILKDVSGNSGGAAINGLPIAKVGDTLTYTLTYDISNPPVNNGVITDPIPAGLEYVIGSATTNTEFDLVAYEPGTRTLTWNADAVTVDGTVSFKVTVLAAAPALTQPILNIATIDSDETAPDDDDASVLVQAVQAITNPPTSALDQSSGQRPANPGFSLMLILLALAAFALSLGFVTPVPGRARRWMHSGRR